MLTAPLPSSCPPSPITVTLILRIVLSRNVRPHVKGLIITHQLDNPNTLIHRCTRTTKPKKIVHRETIAANLANRIIHLGDVKMGTAFTDHDILPAPAVGS